MNQLTIDGLVCALIPPELLYWDQQFKAATIEISISRFVTRMFMPEGYLAHCGATGNTVSRTYVRNARHAFSFETPQRRTGAGIPDPPDNGHMRNNVVILATNRFEQLI